MVHIDKKGKIIGKPSIFHKINKILIKYPYIYIFKTIHILNQIFGNITFRHRRQSKIAILPNI